MLSFLCDCAQEQKSTSIADLAARFHISTRMVRYNLDQIDYYLACHNFPKMKRQKTAGVQLDVDEAMLACIREELSRLQSNIYVLSRSERELYILLQLFSVDAPIRYEELADALSVSRKTVIDDVRHIRESERERKLEIEPTKRGIWYSGGEFCIRSVVIDRMRELFSLAEMWKAIKGEATNKSIPIEKKWFEIAGSLPVQEFEKELYALEVEGDFVYTDEMFYLLMVLAAISVIRYMGGYCVEHRAPQSDRELPMYAAFLRRISRRLEIELPESEYLYVAGEAGRILNYSRYEQAERMSLIVSEGLLAEVSRFTGNNYYMDDKLRADLQRHLFELLKNVRGRRGVDGATVASMLRGNEKLLDCIRECMMGLSGMGDGVWTDSECALIMMHFFAADERWHALGARSYKALVICTNGIGSARLVSARVAKYFPQIQIIDATSIHNMKAIIEKNQPDFILSTVPIQEDSIPVIVVNTLLTPVDIENIRGFMARNPRNSKGVAGNHVYLEIRELIDQTCQVNDEKLLEQSMRRILNVAPPSSNMMAIADLVRRDCIQAGIEARDWEEAVRKSAEPMVHAGCIEARYVDAMVRNIRENGPYIVIAPGIAMPHSMPLDGVHQSCIGLTVLREPVEFGNPGNDPVRIVVCMGTHDGQEHMKSISQLINVLCNPIALKRILEAEDVDEILLVLAHYAQGDPAGDDFIRPV